MAWEMGVFVGFGWGLVVGLVVVYCVGIINVDLIKYDFLFE